MIVCTRLTTGKDIALRRATAGCFGSGVGGTNRQENYAAQIVTFRTVATQADSPAVFQNDAACDP